jgi:catechol 2,3-dioxygenase
MVNSISYCTTWIGLRQSHLLYYFTLNTSKLYIVILITSKLKIDHVHLKVSNLENSLHFYKSILGFKITRQEDNKTVFLSSSSSKINNDLSISLVVLTEIKNIAPPYKIQHKPKIAGLYHFAVLLPERKYLGYFLRHIQKNLDTKYYEGMADHAVSESIYLHDPDLNGIEVYSDRDPKEWKWKGNTVHMVTEPLKVQDLLKESSDVNNEWNELPPGTSIGHVHLHVSKLGKAKRFYKDILELNHTATYPGAYFFAENKYHHHVATNTWLGENITLANKDNNNKPGLDHYAIKLHNEYDLFLLKNRLLEFKIDIDEKLIENDNQLPSSFYAYDFDGIKIQFLYNK